MLSKHSLFVMFDPSEAESTEDNSNVILATAVNVANAANAEGTANAANGANNIEQNWYQHALQKAEKLQLQLDSVLGNLKSEKTVSF